MSHLIASKYKICGRSFELELDETIVNYSSCGSTQFLPNLENDKVRNLFEGLIN
jgi:hypothetical protein